jgi:hypothetical protein
MIEYGRSVSRVDSGGFHQETVVHDSALKNRRAAVCSAARLSLQGSNPDFPDPESEQTFS